MGNYKHQKIYALRVQGFLNPSSLYHVSSLVSYPFYSAISLVYLSMFTLRDPHPFKELHSWSFTWQHVIQNNTIEHLFELLSELMHISIVSKHLLNNNNIITLQSCSQSQVIILALKAKAQRQIEDIHVFIVRACFSLAHRYTDSM